MAARDRRPLCELRSASVEHDRDFDDYGGGYFVRRAPDPLPYRVRLELRANDEFVDALIAFFEAQGVDFGGHVPRASRALTAPLPALEPRASARALPETTVIDAEEVDDDG